MNKVLTISIAAYNIMPYIKENLDSIIASEKRDALEVFVIDDGGKDGTYEFAKEYENQYPGIVYAIHKDNGGYGSVQNYSMRHATGKYFKILDGDDWFDTDGLTRLVEYLETSDVDIVVTDYLKGSDKGSLMPIKFGEKCKMGEIIDTNSLNIAISMHALAYKTSVLIAANMTLPERMLYTDKIYSMVPFIYAKSVIALGFPVYCYRTGREGQSISRESRINHIDEYMSVTETLCKYYAMDKRVHKEYVLLKSSASYKVAIRALLMLPSTKENLDKLKDFERRTKSIAMDVYKKSASMKTRMGWVIRFLRMTGYKGYWLLGKVPKEKIDF